MQISEGDLPAKLDPNGVLTFEEGMLEEHAFSPVAIQALLEKAQREGQELDELGRAMAADRQLLIKVYSLARIHGSATHFVLPFNRR